MSLFLHNFAKRGFIRTAATLSENTQAHNPSLLIPARGVSDPVAFARINLQLDPDPRQIDVLKSTARYGILNCSRQ